MSAGLAWVIAESGEPIASLIRELVVLGFAYERVSVLSLLDRVPAPDVALVVGSYARPHTTTRRACVALRADARLCDIPIVIVLPAGRIPVADPMIDAHELIVLPLRAGELLSRIDRALAARSRPAAPDLSIRAGALRLDPRSRRVWIHEDVVPLSAREFELLDYLARHPSRVHSRPDLLRAVWNGEAGVGTRAVDVQVRRVRAKLGDELGHCIRTVRNVGYACDERAARAVAHD